jgi:hypothetical protein
MFGMLDYRAYKLLWLICWPLRLVMFVGSWGAVFIAIMISSSIDVIPRLAPIGPNRRALLCACYDMFGCTETAHKPRARTGISTGSAVMAWNYRNERKIAAQWLLSYQTVCRTMSQPFPTS